MQYLTRSNACRTAATAAVLLLGSALLPPLAGATGVRGRTVGAESVTSASWGVTASVASMTFTSRTDQTSTVTNTGNVPLVAESFSVQVSKPTRGAPRFRVFECATPWVANRCSGGTGTQVGGTLASNTTTTITAAVALAVGGVFYLQVQPAGAPASSTVTITTLVTAPTQVRAPVRTNQ